jgi:hypothetical protein
MKLELEVMQYYLLHPGIAIWELGSNEYGNTTLFVNQATILLQHD